jgi:hypothetical protein
LVVVEVMREQLEGERRFNKGTKWPSTCRLESGNPERERSGLPLFQRVHDENK